MLNKYKIEIKRAHIVITNERKKEMEKERERNKLS